MVANRMDYENPQDGWIIELDDGKIYCFKPYLW